MFFGHGIEKDPFSRVSLKNISFEPSRRPSGATVLRYRNSFCGREESQGYKASDVLLKSPAKRKKGIYEEVLRMPSKPPSRKLFKTPILLFTCQAARMNRIALVRLILGMISSTPWHFSQIVTSR